MLPVKNGSGDFGKRWQGERISGRRLGSWIVCIKGGKEMARSLEWALVMLVSNIITITFAFWVATTVGNEVTRLFSVLLDALPKY